MMRTEVNEQKRGCSGYDRGEGGRRMGEMGGGRDGVGPVNPGKLTGTDQQRCIQPCLCLKCDDPCTEPL